MSNNSIFDKIISRNQNNYRLTNLVSFDSISSDAQVRIKQLLSSKDDRAHHALGILLYGLVSARKSIVKISARDLDKLIVAASGELKIDSFKILSERKDKENKSTKTIWAQMTKILIEMKIMNILVPQKGQVPATIQIVDAEWLTLINPVNESHLYDIIGSSNTGSFLDYAIQTVNTNSTLKSVTSSLNFSFGQYLNSATLQNSNTTNLQHFNSSSSSESSSESKTESQVSIPVSNDSSETKVEPTPKKKWTPKKSLNTEVSNYRFETICERDILTTEMIEFYQSFMNKDGIKVDIDEVNPSEIWTIWMNRPVITKSVI